MGATATIMGTMALKTKRMDIIHHRQHHPTIKVILTMRRMVRREVELIKCLKIVSTATMKILTVNMQGITTDSMARELNSTILKLSHHLG